MAITTIFESLVLVGQQNGVVVIPAATPLTRLNYFDGKFLRASDLKAEQDYLRQLVRQSNQAGGAGVAYGYDVALGGGVRWSSAPAWRSIRKAVCCCCPERRRSTFRS